MKTFQYRLGYIAGILEQWRKRYSLQYLRGYIAGKLRL